ncbi:MAG TPA: hypothetical protein VJ821_10135 [Anaerolineales bacterium]|nr:hypothetical protein [Anaerolineales bacterium]
MRTAYSRFGAETDSTGTLQLNHDDNLIVLDSHLVHPQPAFVGQAGAGEQIEFPAMPGAGQDLALAAPDPLAWGRWEGRAPQAAKADRRELMRADVLHSHIAATNVEDADRPPLKFNDPPPARRNLPCPGDDHSVPPLVAC